LEVKNLETRFKARNGYVYAVNGVSFSLEKGEMLGVVGESGCGKSVTMMSLIKLLPPSAEITSGEVFLDGEDISHASAKKMNYIRGVKVGMIFQDPMTSLNPFVKIGLQLAEGIMYHKKLSKEEAHRQAGIYLDLVGISNSTERLNEFPQKVLIADEPTTALDVTIQAQILELINELAKKLNTAVILITHDLGVVAGMCDTVCVMYAGKIVEKAKTEDLYASPSHPYTFGLIQSVPRLDKAQDGKLYSIEGQPPNVIDLPECCPFHPRCNKKMDICTYKYPPVKKVGENHEVACWLYADEKEKSST